MLVLVTISRRKPLTVNTRLSSLNDSQPHSGTPLVPPFTTAACIRTNRTAKKGCDRGRLYTVFLESSVYDVLRHPAKSDEGILTNNKVAKGCTDYSWLLYPPKTKLGLSGGWSNGISADSVRISQGFQSYFRAISRVFDPPSQGRFQPRPANVNVFGPYAGIGVCMFLPKRPLRTFRWPQSSPRGRRKRQVHRPQE